MSPGKRKRVTFAEESPVVHLIPAPESRGDGSEDDSGKSCKYCTSLQQGVSKVMVQQYELLVQMTISQADFTIPPQGFKVSWCPVSPQQSVIRKG